MLSVGTANWKFAECPLFSDTVTYNNTYMIFILADSKLSARKYTGCISVMGYFCRPVLNGSRGNTSGLSERQYWGGGGR